MSDKVFCLVCYKTNKKSKCWLVKKVWHEDTTNNFYDENGEYHVINSECLTYTFICDFGHKWTREYKSGCDLHNYPGPGQISCKYKTTNVEKPVPESWFKRLFKRKK